MPTAIRTAASLFTLSLAGLGVVTCGSGADDPMGNAGGGPASSPNGLEVTDAGTSVGPAPTPGSFIAFQRDFQSFASWTRFELGSEVAIGDGNIHRTGRRAVYVNRLPASGAVSFDTGTIIVKTMQTGEVFARVKRGGEYNRSGNVGWEWFELKQVGTEWVIAWRGITPPAGFCYGGIVGGACNDCHRVFAHNDFVATSALDLSKL